jgi:hypothetical protein
LNKTGFMCEIDYFELNEGFVCFVYPSVRVAPEHCRPELGRVEISPARAATQERGAIPDRRRGHRTYFMRAADLNPATPFPADGAPIFDTIEGIWRVTPVTDRSIVRVEINFVEKLYQETPMKARAFAYEDLYYLLGLVHPGVATVQ